MEVLEIFEQSLIFTLAIAIPSTVIICIFKFSPPTLGDLGGENLNLWPRKDSYSDT